MVIVLCNGVIIHVATGCHGFAGKYLQNDLAKKSGKDHVVPVILVAMLLGHCCFLALVSVKQHKSKRTYKNV